MIHTAHLQEMTAVSEMNTTIRPLDHRPSDNGVITVSEIVVGLIDQAVISLKDDPESCRNVLSRATGLLRSVRAVTQPPGGGGADSQLWPTEIPWRVRNVLSHIEKVLAEPLRTQDLARIMGLSTTRFFKEFKSAIGAPPLKYITRRRVELACSMMLDPEQTLSAIALECGFCDQSHLCRAFRRTLGISPARWRRRHLAVPLPMP